MLLIFFMIFLFIYIINFLFPLIIEKQQLDQKLFKLAKDNLYTNVSCINNYWVVISRNMRYLNISYFKDGVNAVSCNETDLSKFYLISCSEGNLYNDTESVCYNTLMSLIFLLKN